jgi:pilus assembly protein CpaF
MALDYAVVQQLRAEVAGQLRTERRRRSQAGAAALTGEDERQLGRSLSLAAVAEQRRTELVARGGALPPATEDAALAEAVHAALFGLGRLAPLIADMDLNNIEINGADRVWLYRRDGRVLSGPPVADSDDELVEWVRTAAAYSGLSSRPFDPVHPFCDVRLPDGSRLSATMAVCERPAVSIRLYRHERVHLADLHRTGAFGDQLGAFLAAAVAARANLMVSGETFAGKTTLLRALGNAVPATERLVTCEHFLELGFGHFPDLHRDVVALEERLPNAEGAGGVDVAALVERARRMNPDRLAVGEVMGGEVVAMLDAMTHGEGGSLSTIHSRDSRTVFDRIALYAARAERPVPPTTAGMLTAAALDFVVHLSLTRLPGGRLHRHVASVREVVGFDGAQVLSSEVFATPPGELLARPAAAITGARAARLAGAGYHPAAWGMAA